MSSAVLSPHRRRKKTVSPIAALARSMPADPHSPTQAVPGSEEKIHVLTLRHELGLPLFNPADRRDHAARPLREARPSRV